MLSKFWTSALCLCVSAALAACASSAPQRDEGLQDLLQLQILDNGTKLVHYRLRVQPPRREGVKVYDWESNRGGFGGDIYRDESQKKQTQQHLERRLMNRLEERLQEFSICRQGYVVLEQQVFLGVGSVRLECKDAASSAERRRFGERWQYPASVQSTPGAPKP